MLRGGAPLLSHGSPLMGVTVNTMGCRAREGRGGAVPQGCGRKVGRFDARPPPHHGGAGHVEREVLVLAHRHARDLEGWW